MPASIAGFTESELGQLAVTELERRRDNINARLAELKQKYPGATTTATRRPGTKPTGSKPMSEEGRARIAKAQKRRWAQKRKLEAAAAGTSGPSDAIPAE